MEALLPHAISLEQSGDGKMIDAIYHVARNSIHWSFSWESSRSYMAHLLSEQTTTTPSLDRAAALLSPYLFMHRWSDKIQWNKQMVIGWTAAVSRVLYSKEVGSSVVDTLLQLWSEDTLRPHIPIGIWAWLKKKPSLPPSCYGRYTTMWELVPYLRGFGDLDILKSYFVAVWSEWDDLEDSHFSKTQTSIVEDFGGIGMQHHRGDLITRLDHVLGQLDRGSDHFKQFNWWAYEVYVEQRKEQYGSLREVLLEANEETKRALTGMSRRLTGLNRCTNSRGTRTESHSTFTCSLPLPCP